MTFVILQPCCNDASCTDVCPVDCIHPTPDEPDFMHADMLHIDPDTCIDCGACVDECPVDAIRADHEIDSSQEAYLGLNARYFDSHTGGTAAYASPTPPWKGSDFSGRRIAVVGSGPAAFYTVLELSAARGIEIEVYDRLLSPYGLVRAGVAPDHQQTKTVANLFRSAAGKKSVRVHLGIEIGSDITHDELAAHHDAVVYATGAPNDRPLGIDGEDLPGSHSASEFVGWYNGHPDFADRTFDLSTPRAVVIGNGNVALDVARILTADPDDLSRTDVAEHALEALQHSMIREVYVVGRRGPAQAKFTVPELLALTSIPDVDVVVNSARTRFDDVADTRESEVCAVMSRLRDISREPQPSTHSPSTHSPSAHRPDPQTRDKKRIVLQFQMAPVSISGTDSVDAVHFAHTVVRTNDDGVAHAELTDDYETVNTGLVIRSAGFRGREIAGLPFDSARGVIPNTDGRVIDHSGAAMVGVYVAGWIKRGPTGVIGTNRKCAADTVGALLEDIAAGRTPTPPCDREALDALLARKAPAALDFSDWSTIDSAEVSAGKPTGRPRIKIVDPELMRAAATRAREDRY